MPGNRLDDYEVVCTIGTGSYGICKKIRRRSDGKIRVWKELNYGSMSDSEKQLLVSEVNLLRELKHDHIVRYHDRIIEKSSTSIYIIMEYCEGGDLSQVISKHKKERHYIEEKFVWKVLFQLSSALKECHKRSSLGSAVLHRDLKPANVFLTSGNDIKLGDFGLARVLHHETSFAKTFVGTPYYMSPELFSRTCYNEKSDVWSLGCLLYELCALTPPFLAPNQKMLGLKIKEGTFKPIPSQYTPDLQKVIATLLTVDDERRPSMENVLTSQLVQRNLLTNHITATVSHDVPRDQPKEKRKCQPVQQQPAPVPHPREEKLRSREAALESRERELAKQERAVAERERSVEEKLRHAETMLSNLNVRGGGGGARGGDWNKENVPAGGRDKENRAAERLFLDTKQKRALRFIDENADHGRAVPGGYIDHPRAPGGYVEPLHDPTLARVKRSHVLAGFR